MKKTKIYIILVFLFTSNFVSQTLDQYFPLKLKTDGTEFSQSDYSSAFGPRKHGDDNYDFHAAIDIAAINGTAVYPIYSGTVLEYITNASYPNDDNITILHQDDNGYFMTRYYHIDKLSGINEGDPVVGGSTQIATVKDYNNDGADTDHLDVRYCEEGETMADWGNYFLNASNPGYVLNEAGQEDTYPWLVKANGNELPVIYSFPLQDALDGRGKYFEFGVRVAGWELDLNKIYIDLTGYPVGGGILQEADLLLEPNNSFNDPLTEVNYNFTYNCGDKTASDSDKGHNSKTVGIYPASFNTGENAHRVSFRWYIDESQ